MINNKAKESYNSKAVVVARGLLGYVPAQKSRYSKSASSKWLHKAEFM